MAIYNTNQEAFSAIRKHLLSMIEPCMIGEMCSYRNPNGNKCAIGGIIPDELYSPDFEGVSVDFLPIYKKLFNKDVDVNLVVALQEVHDNREMSAWPILLQEIADQYGVKNV